MSFKIFSLQLRGKIKPVSVIERQRKALADDYAEFQRVSASEELKAFLELEKYVKSSEFTSKKKEIEALQFKGSEEDNLLKELQRLKKSVRIRKFFKVDGSSDLKKYEAEKDAQRMKDYYALFEFMKEGQFEKEKKEIQGQVFKGSVEEKHWNDYRRLDKSAAIRAHKELDGSEKLKKHLAVGESEKLKKYNELKNSTDKEKKKEFKSIRNDAELKAYFRFEKSKKLKLYHEVSGSHDLTRYNELTDYVNTGEFKERESYLKDKKKFEKSEAYKKQTEFKRLAADANVKFVLKYEKSALYKNYLDVKDSFDLKRYHELNELTQGEEFKKKKAWLEDKKRWEKTEDCKKLQQYEQDKKKAELVTYFKYKDSSAFDFFQNWETAFEDSFGENKLKENLWATCSETASKTLGENFAMPGDISLFTNGSNLKLANKLTIQVKKEKAQGKVWQMPSGFVPAEFDYTSGQITTEKKFTLEDGILEAKIKFNPVKQVVSSFYLAGDGIMPRVNVIEMGPNNMLGISTINGTGKVQSTGLDISNLKPGEYIFTLEKNGSAFSWKINETEVHTENNSTLNQALSLNASSLVIAEVPGSSLPANFDVEWVKCYRKK